MEGISLPHGRLKTLAALFNATLFCRPYCQSRASVVFQPITYPAAQSLVPGFYR